MVLPVPKTRRRLTPNSVRLAARSACSKLTIVEKRNEGGLTAALVHCASLIPVRRKADCLNRIERPDRTPHLAERQSREIGAGRARSLDEHDPPGDWFEGRPKMALPLQSQYAVSRRLDAVAAEHIEVDRGLCPCRDQDLDRRRRGTGRGFAQQQRGWAKIDGEAGHHGPVVDVATVAEELDVGAHWQRVSMELVGLSAKIDGNLSTRSRRDSLPHHLRIT